ncbi:hypothetical protein [Streptomyces kanamyceticus]|uniref:Uncharacterized protein n=1 Tax=Streptomyces kanamyceticus TaxID=1967 RepID=A0A5J6GF74_STRKN|nr:hypothetical protein [Streptomyces kanamyceticus]QEU94209.1 hypothetical protein CP970_27845 [Streptomyces kanamyceticus]
MKTAYTPRNWWTEILLGTLVTLTCTALVLVAAAWAVADRGGSINVLGGLVPGLAAGTWSARRYRRRHTS